MIVDKLILPPEIGHLIEKSLWPTTEEETIKQYHFPLISSALIADCIEGEEQLIFYKPPFMTARERLELGDEINLESFSGDVTLDSSLLVILGDFGMGSDAFWGLYYQSENDLEPKVVREKWSNDSDIVGWVDVSESFSDFCCSLELLG